MRRLARLIPTADDLARNRAKIGGFVVGLVTPLVAAAFFSVLYTGYGLSETPEPPPVIYPNF